MRPFVLLLFCLGYTRSDPRRARKHDSSEENARVQTSAGDTSTLGSAIIDGENIRMRVVGGGPVSIERYPSAAVVLRLEYHGDKQICGGVILSQRHILTAAHCFKTATTFQIDFKKYQVRVGSSYAHNLGVKHKINLIMYHPRYHMHNAYENDLAIMRTEQAMVFGTTVQPALIASGGHHIPDNDTMWAVGWGEVAEGARESEQLRHVEVKAINQNHCKTLFKHYHVITDNLLCAGWLNGGNHDHCYRDSGSPLYHRGVVVGIASLGKGCGQEEFPGLNVRVSSYAGWIRDKAQAILHD